MDEATKKLVDALIKRMDALTTQFALHEKTISGHKKQHDDQLRMIKNHEVRIRHLQHSVLIKKRNK